MTSVLVCVNLSSFSYLPGLLDQVVPSEKGPVVVEEGSPLGRVGLLRLHRHVEVEVSAGGVVVIIVSLSVILGRGRKMCTMSHRQFPVMYKTTSLWMCFKIHIIFSEVCFFRRILGLFISR